MITRQTLRPLADAITKQWICASCPSTASSKAPGHTAQSQRTLFTRVDLPDHASFIRYGIRGAGNEAAGIKPEDVQPVYSRDGYMFAYAECQRVVLAKLNKLAAGTAAEHLKPKDIALRAAHDPAKAALFNYASLAHNNHFFFEQFSKNPKPLRDFSKLRESIVNSFGSVETFEREFKDTAASVFGQGFVWLVNARDLNKSSGAGRDQLRILTTYNAGTPYSEAGFRQQSLDMNTTDAAGYGQYKKSIFGDRDTYGSKNPPGGTNVVPLLCVSMWQHSYLRDFGQAGKEEYLDAFWEAIDWDVVRMRQPPSYGESRPYR